ncbi:hypothetical protein [Oceanobacter mangrovi]|nr:hypothetical protein [Oceanobacter mangrovi]
MDYTAIIASADMTTAVAAIAAVASAVFVASVAVKGISLVKKALWTS